MKRRINWWTLETGARVNAVLTIAVPLIATALVLLSGLLRLLGIGVRR